MANENRREKYRVLAGGEILTRLEQQGVVLYDKEYNMIPGSIQNNIDEINETIQRFLTEQSMFSEFNFCIGEIFEMVEQRHSEQPKSLGHNWDIKRDFPGLFS